MNLKPSHKSKRPSLNNDQFQTNLEPIIDKQRPNEEMNNERRIAISNFVSADLQELDEKVKSMVEKSQNFISNGKRRADICKVCGKEEEGIAIRDHIEANHLEGLSLPCNLCDNILRSRLSLRKHMRANHK